jgi:serine/threonine-protein kinase HipA
MTSERECFVYLMLPGEVEFVTAARFVWAAAGDGGGVGRLVYGRRYLERANAVELDPVQLRLGRSTFTTARLGGFFGAIRDSMPDYWGRRVIERNAGLTELDELDYLLRGPDDRAGALGFGLNAEPPLPERRYSRTLDLPRVLDAVAAVLDEHPEDAGSARSQVEELLLAGTSMGGARPKAVVHEDDALWLAKFSRPSDRYNHPRVEHAMLTLARDAGLTAAESRLVKAAGQDVLLVRRFDRDASHEGFRRHRMVSALTLLGAEDDVSDRARWSYLLFADELRRASGAPGEDLRELFARMCFNAAVSNLDDHPRNHALLAKGRQWRLSPAYDLTPSPVMSLERRDLSMACGRFGRWANRENLISGAGRFLIEPAEASAIFDDVVARVRGWHATFRRAGVSESDCAAVSRAFVYDGLFYDG